MSLSTERINEVGDEIFVGSTFLESFFFVFYNDFVVGDLDDFFAGDKKFGVHNAFHDGAPNEDLLDEKIIRVNGEIDDLTKFAAFFGFDFEGEEVEI